MAVCKLEYLDENGERSKVYYDNLDKGQEYARKAYLDHMAKHAFAKLQVKEVSNEDLITRGNKLKLTPDESHYETPNGVKLRRATSFIGSVQDEFNSERIAKEVSRRDVAQIILKDNLEKFEVSPREFKTLSKMAIYDLPGMVEAVDSWVEKNPKKFESKVNNLLELWDFKREAGTEIHEVLEWYINERSALKPDEYGNYDYDKAKSNVLKKLEIVGSNTKPKEFSILIDQIESWVKTLPSNMKFETEIRVYDEELGVAGTIDLMAFDENDNVYIFDYKTKEVNKQHLFDIKGDLKMREPLGHLHDNKENLGSLQTSLYRLILERQGKRVKGAEIVYIEADVEQNHKGDYVYNRFKHVTNKRLRYYRSELGKMFSQEGIDIDKETKRNIEEGKVNNTSDILYEISGKSEFNDYKNIDDTVLRILDQVKVDKRSGKEYFDNKITGKREYFKSNEIDERKLQLKSYLNDIKRDRDKLSSNFIEYFNKGKWSKNDPISAHQASNLLGGITRDTHNLEQVKNFYGFESTNPNIVIAISKYDNSSKLFYVGATETSMEFDGLSESELKEHTTIFGNLMSDKAFKRRFGFDGLYGTDSNLKLLELGILGAELKKAGHIDSIESISSGIINGYERNGEGSVKPKVLSMNTILPHIKALNELTTDNLSSYMSSVIGSPKYTSPSTYNTDYRKTLRTRIFDEFNNVSKSLKETVDGHLNSHINGELRDSELLSSLIKTQREIVRTLKGKGIKTTEDLALEDDYVLISKVIAQVANVNMNIGEISHKISMDSKLRTTGRIANESIRQLDSKIKSTELSINKDFKKFHNKHKKLVKALIDEHSLSTVGTIDLKEVFTPLFLVDPNKKINEQDAKSGDLFKLKPLSDNSLTKVQKDYIKFFNESVLNGFGYVFSDTRMEGLKEGKTWEEGRVPLMLATSENKAGKSDSNVYADLVKRNFTKNIKNNQEDFNQINTRLENRYVRQAKPGFMGGSNRQNLLGLRSDGSIKSEPSNLETNLEVILNNFMTDNMRSFHYEETLGVYNAMNVIAMVDQNENFNDNEKVIKFMGDYIKLIVFNEHNKEGKAANTIDIAQKTMTMMSLGFSPKQAILEGATNTFANVSAMMSQQILGKYSRFGLGDWSKAFGTVSNSELRGSIVSEFGLYRSDSESFGSSDYAETRKNFWFQSKWAYALNNIPFKAFRTQTFIAELHKKGIMPAISHINGEMVYDVTKDQRFNLLFDNGKLIDKTLLNKEEQLDQRALYDSLVEDLYQEGNLTEEGYPKTPLSYKEINAMKHYSMKLYGSVDKDAKVLAQASVWGRMFLKFKNWAISKKDNWWTPTHMSELVGRRVKVPMLDDNGLEIPGEFYYEFQDMKEQGVIQGLMEFYTGIDSWTELNFKETWDSMDPNQKETLVKGITDLITAAILLGLLSLLLNFDFFTKDKRGKILMQTLTNATADLNVMSTMLTMTDNSPIAVAGYAKRTVSSLFGVVSGAVTGDYDSSIEHAIKTTGMSKSADALINY